MNVNLLDERVKDSFNKIKNDIDLIKKKYRAR
jgi:hypothetical protein